MAEKVETITRRIEPCNCGCGGTDSWHAREFKRVIHDIQSEVGTADVLAYRHPVHYRRIGWAQFPWGRAAVVDVWHVRGNLEVRLGWFIAREK